uniref:Regulator of nonsense transcripts UPF2-like n=1 Tax=Rhizophora mucronata TaxID=61149 RepID=A0A2P2L835_RHIMU
MRHQSKMNWIHQKIVSASEWLLHFLRHVDTTLNVVLLRGNLIDS